MATKTSKKIRASRVTRGMVLAENGKPLGKIISRNVHTQHHNWPSPPSCTISFELDGSTDIIAYAAGPSEWIEVMR